MIFDLVRDFAEVLEAMPGAHPRYGLLSLLDEAVRRDTALLSRSPGVVFQSLWNRCWWYDCPDAAAFYDPPDGGWPAAGPPWASPGPHLYELMERWRGERRELAPCEWLRALRPPAEPVGGPSFTPLEMSGSGYACCVAFSPDGSWLAVGEREGEVHLWSVPDLRWVRRLDAAPGVRVYAVAFSPDGGRLASASRDGSVWLWDVPGGAGVALTTRPDHDLRSVAFSPDGRRLAALAYGSDTAHVWDLAAGAGARRIPLQPGAASVSFLPGSDCLVAGPGAGDGLRLYDCRTGECVRRVPCATGSNWFRAHVLRGRRALVAVDRALRLHDLGGGSPPFETRLDEDIDAVALSPDAGLAAAATADHRIEVWDVRAGRRVATLAGHTHSLRGLDFSADGRWLCSGGKDRTPRVWTSLRDRPPPRLKGLDGDDNNFFGPRMALDDFFGRRVGARLAGSTPQGQAVAAAVPGSAVGLCQDPEGRHWAMHGDGPAVRLYRVESD